MWPHCDLLLESSFIDAHPIQSHVVDASGPCVLLTFPNQVTTPIKIPIPTAMYHQTSMCIGPHVAPGHLLPQKGREKTISWHFQRHCEAGGLAQRVNQKGVNSCEFAACTTLARGHKMSLDFDSKQSPDLSLRSNFDPFTDRVLTLDTLSTLTPAQM